MLARLPPTSLMAALESCKPLADLTEAACGAACLHQRPAWVAVAQADAVAAAARGSGTSGKPPTHSWQQQLVMLVLLRQEAEQHGLMSAAGFRQMQPQSREGHRKILVEWLCEVRALWLQLHTRRCLLAANFRDQPPCQPLPRPPSVCTQLSFLWRLDSPILFKAVEYLDCHLCQARSIDLSKYAAWRCTAAGCDGVPARPAGWVT